MKYYIIKCRDCGQFAIREIKNLRTYRFRCFHCNTFRQLFIKKQIQSQLRIHGAYDDIKEARKCLSYFLCEENPVAKQVFRGVELNENNF